MAKRKLTWTDGLLALFIIAILLLLVLLANNLHLLSVYSGNIDSCPQGVNATCIVTVSSTISTPKTYQFANLIINPGVTLTINAPVYFNIVTNDTANGNGYINISGTINGNGAVGANGGSGAYSGGGGNGGSGGGGGSMQSYSCGSIQGYGGTGSGQARFETGGGTGGGTHAAGGSTYGGGQGGGRSRSDNGGTGGTSGSNGARGACIYQSPTKSGGGGGGSGYAIKFTGYYIYILPGGSVTANGGTGGDGHVDYYMAGGGGGGAGEIIFNSTIINTASSNQITANGGDGNTGFLSGGNCLFWGNSGSGGGGGFVHIYYTTNQITGSVSVSGGSSPACSCDSSGNGAAGTTGTITYTSQPAFPQPVIIPPTQPITDFWGSVINANYINGIIAQLSCLIKLLLGGTC